ncbi:MAG: rRNA pseudouridine synthase [Clostridia bacterium]|nr:rRNA pseudouridine synthase [Clostridia bacterium]
METKIRLQKYLSACGIASRRKAEALIAAGLVKVNGNTAAVGDKIDPARDVVTVRGRKVALKKQHTYVALYKPRGFVSTMRDEHGRKCVSQLVEGVGTRVFPVGRLDKDSEGLLLMTDDGALTNRLTHPSGHVPKIYRVTVRPDVSDAQADELATGVLLDGRMTNPAEVKVLLREENRTVLEIVLTEGRNRQIRRMLESIDVQTVRLKRIAVGPVRIGMLKPGEWRRLTEQEVAQLKKMTKSSS